MVQHPRVLLLLMIARLVASAKRPIQDLAMEVFCQQPPNFGKGTYDAKANTCNVNYAVYTADLQAAQDFCDMQHPFTLKKATAGENTKCEIMAEMSCGREVLIGEKCFTYDSDAIYSEAEEKCKSNHRTADLHLVTSTFEQKWISTFFSTYGLMWVKNTKSDLKYLLVSELGEGKALVNPEARIEDEAAKHHVIVLRKGTPSMLKPGSLALMKDFVKLPVLCSRPAEATDLYLKSLAERMEAVGYKTTMANDLADVTRPFTVVRSMVTFEMADEHDAGTQRIHKACEAFENGYAASPWDFSNMNDFKKALRNANVNVVAVPGHKESTGKSGNRQDCTRDPRYEENRKHFFFDIKKEDGSTFLKAATNSTFWAAGYPDKICADMPRAGLAFSQNGLLDVPNFARIFVMCTFGAPPSVKPDDLSASCSPLATFKKDGKCVCKPGHDDLRETKEFLRRKSDLTNAQGDVCLSCRKYKEMDWVIILERSWGWNYDTWYPMISLTFAATYYAAGVRAMLLTEKGVEHDTKEHLVIPYAKPGYAWTAFGTTDSYYDTGKDVPSIKLTEAIERGFQSILKRPAKRKVFMFFLGNVPQDIEAAQTKFSELQSQTAFSVESVVALRWGRKAPKALTDLSTAQRVYVLEGGLPQGCLIGSRVIDVIKRQFCVVP